MDTFNRLETAALEAMAAVSPDQEILLEQFRHAAVTERENTGAGFYTHFTIDRAAVLPLPLTINDTGAVAEVEGFDAPLLLILWWEDGYPTTLEGASCGDDTSTIDFANMAFKVKSAASPERR